MNAIVIGYSKLHFSTEGPKAPFANSSAGFLARAIYTAASQVSSEVYYLDATSPNEWPVLQEVGVLISIESCFIDLNRKYRPSKSLLFSVNQEAATSVQKWLKPIESGDLPWSSILGGYDLNSRDPRAIAEAGRVLMVGDNLTYGTFLTKRHAADLHAVGYGYGEKGNRTHSDTSRDLVLIPASSIGTRKGSDLIEKLCMEIARNPAKPLRIGLLGSSSNSYWSSTLKRLEREYEGLIESYGWVNSQTSPYKDVEDRALCCVFPSREEGLVGMAVEAIRSGIPTFTTLECGLGPRPKSFTLALDDETNWSTRILNFCKEPDKTSAPWPEEGRLQSTEEVSRAVRRFIESGELHPLYYVDDSGPIFRVSRHPVSGAMGVNEWLQIVGNKTPILRDDLLDKLLLAMSELDQRSRADTVEVLQSEANVGHGCDQLGSSDVGLLGSVQARRVVEVSTHRNLGLSTIKVAWIKLETTHYSRKITARFLSYIVQIYAGKMVWRIKPVRRRLRNLKYRRRSSF